METTTEQHSRSPHLPTFAPDERKSIVLSYGTNPEGTITIEIESEGLDDDINQIALLMAFTLEKLLTSD